ncbi:MOSC domain-containing protein [Halopiger djelfimassiliensis]|uniref:MOSC domain-containing protein n=1 Tax=Halopiger djelfimassiliensis TaxID=1293047 RepID=UPI000677DA07|nr:MOSC N-terminal beta barrel domain-containing protein [Halopiger djelfimassiliensis]
MAHIDRLRVYPVKGLDGIELEEATILEGGTLARDREFVLIDNDRNVSGSPDPDGDVINGKRTDRVHDLATDFDPETGVLEVEAPDGDTDRFDLEADADRERAEAWFGDFFDADLTLERDRSRGFVDRRGMGPSVISTATLRTVASWFDGMTVEGARRRLRANVEVSGVEPFWEDRFVGASAPSFTADGITFEGVTPCGRCVVPRRDPDTGDPIPEFQQRFVEKRRETFPDWADEEAFDHYYAVMLITRVPEDDRGATVAVGDPVTVADDCPSKP